jgi:hypothetical protein
VIICSGSVRIHIAFFVQNARSANLNSDIPVCLSTEVPKVTLHRRTGYRSSSEDMPELCEAQQGG